MVDVPDLKPGNYRIAISLETGTKLGTLTSERDIVIEDPVWDIQSVNYVEYLKEGNKEEAGKARQQMLAKWFTNRVDAGQACVLDEDCQVNEGDYPGSDELRAAVKWYPQEDYLRVRAEVVDAFFNTDVPDDKPFMASSVEIFASGSGVDDHITQYIVAPRGAGGIPYVRPYHETKTDGIISAWKRTDDGYVIDLKIPWELVKGADGECEVLPIEVGLNSSTPKGRVQLIWNRTGMPWVTARGYGGLRLN